MKRKRVSLSLATSSEELKQAADEEEPNKNRKTSKISIRHPGEKMNGVDVSKKKPTKTVKAKVKKANSWGARLANAAASAASAKEEEAALAQMERERRQEETHRKQELEKTNLTGFLSSSKIARNHEARRPRNGEANGVNPDELTLGSLSQLTKVLDKKLYDGGPRGAKAGNYPVLDGLIHQPRDSMGSLLGYNQIKGDWREHISKTTYNVAIVFGKRLVRDQVTVEYASRIRTLASLFKYEPHFSPSLVCFWGGVGDDNHVSDADAGYIFFRHMCEAQGISLEGVEIFIDSVSKDEKEAVRRVTEEVQKNHLNAWIQKSAITETDTNLEEHVTEQNDSLTTINLHFSFISTEYHLCNINDIHHRSPGQSFLQPLYDLEEASRNSNSAYRRGATDKYDDYDDYGDSPYSISSSRSSTRDSDSVFSSSLEQQRMSDISGIVEASWSFQYATYPYVHAKEDAIVFLGKCYLLGEELMPLFVNMKGVVENTEFFQRDNYLMLASIRRSLVSHVEELHKPRRSLRSSLDSYCKISLGKPKRSGKNNYNLNDRSVDVVLESALLSLGRCIDLVQPAGLLVSTVSKSDWLKALRALEHSMADLRSTCDPDRPLRPSEWGKLIDEGNRANSTSLLEHEAEETYEEKFPHSDEGISDEDEFSIFMDD
eukprot:CAMPEP_0195512970 /NCGR_PEP_ID=MMETSP0794_2-20130614/4744_1 /TAXON_ID=515487 /ORGANISM="Stephanopyxis turris, Strain CCMP 815" /LENGTH=658 /DNA_ID=CAMNT_0040640869 /DNA_START=303 /DNA_END=2279 /DNA_ORIENTATION=+